jgi:hypothetical protein
MPDKVKLARLCLLVAGWLKFATAGFFLFVLAAGAVLVGGGERAGLLGSVLIGATGVLFCGASAVAGAVDLIAAAGVRRRAGYGRVLGVVLGVLMIPLFPAGTVLGVFILSGLLGADARAWFSSWPAGS